MFGLPEEDGEELETKISGVFEEIGLKPKLEAQRIGKKKTASSFFLSNTYFNSDTPTAICYTQV